MAEDASPPKRRRGRPRGGERAPDRSRADLLDAAAKLFAVQGFEATSVSQLCERAGLAKGTFYWTFESKEALFAELVMDRIERPIHEAIEMLREASSEEDAAEETNRRFLEAMRRDRNALLLDDEYWRRALRDPRIRKRYRQRQRELRAALAAALEQRRRRLGGPEFDTPPEHLAIAFLALLSGIGRSRLVDPAGIPDGLFGEFLAITYAGLVARAAPPKPSAPASSA